MNLNMFFQLSKIQCILLVGSDSLFLFLLMGKKQKQKIRNIYFTLFNESLYGLVYFVSLLERVQQYLLENLCNMD